MQATVCFLTEGYPIHLECVLQGWKHSPTICHGLIQAALEESDPPEHLPYINDIIMWDNKAVLGGQQGLGVGVWDLMSKELSSRASRGW